MTNAALLLLRLIVPSLVDAVSWQGSRATEVDDVNINWGPLPTDIQSESFEMVKRGQYPMTVCGFVGGDLNLPATCSSHSTCVWFSDYSVVGCCATGSKTCFLPTSCIDGGSPHQTGADDPLVYTCHSECYINTYPIGYKEIGCGYSTWATSVGTDGAPGMDVFITMTGGNGVSGAAGTSPRAETALPTPPASSKPLASPSSAPPSPTVSSTSPSTPSSMPSTSSSNPSSSTGSAQASSATSSSASSSASSSSGSSPASSPSISSISSSSNGSPGGARGSGSSPGSGASAAGVSSTTSSAAPAATGNDSHSNVGAIAGGAVGGGVAAIAAAAAVIIFMLRRSKRRKYQDPHNINEPVSSVYEDGRLSQHTATPYGSPAEMYTPVMGSSHLPDPYERPSSYQYSPMMNNQRYQPYRPPPAELPYNPSMPHELPAG